MRRWTWAGSLRLRLLGATLVTLTLAIVGTHWWLGGLFRDHVLRQFDSALTLQLDQITAHLDFDAQGQPQIDPRELSDPRWGTPYSGLYWQLDRLDANGGSRNGVLRSRSLWDAQLNLGIDELTNGTVHRHDVSGPKGEALRVAERSVQVADQPQTRWRLLVAADKRGVLEAMQSFHGVLTASLLGLGFLLALAALAQVSVGLAPLKTMQRALQQVREGRTLRLEGTFPVEVQPLVNEFNDVLKRNADMVARARMEAGNLAHGLKTPLAALENAAEQAPPSDLSAMVKEQVRAAQRHTDWHLARARAAGAQRLPGLRTPLQPVVSSLLRVMSKLHADRALQLDADSLSDQAAFAGEEQDLQEMLGNLLDNACRSARSAVHVHARVDGPWLHIDIDDDGPGIAPNQRDAVMQRGVRLDESRPGSGLGLAIVLELAQLYGGDLMLGASASGGLRASLKLPTPN